MPLFSYLSTESKDLTDPCWSGIVPSRVFKQAYVSRSGPACSTRLTLALPSTLQVIVAGISARINQQLRQRMINI